MTAKTKNILVRYFVATVGLFLVGFGVALSIISNLGTAPLSCPAYVLNLKIPAVTVGSFTIFINTLYVFIQLALLRRQFKLKYLLQIVASAFFGYFIDASMWMLSWLTLDSFISRILCTILAAAVTALGTSLEVASKGWMLSAEMTVAAFAQVFRSDFGRTKIIMDSSLVVISAVLAYIFFSNPFGSTYSSFADVLFARSSGVVIGLGTLILSFLIGYLMRFTDKPIGRLTHKLGCDKEF